MSAGLLFVPGILVLIAGIIASLLTWDELWILTGLSFFVIWNGALLLYAVSDWRMR